MDFRQVARAEIRRCVELQEEAGVDIVTDGEQARDNFYSFVADRLAGVRLMSLAEMLEHVEDREGFEELLERLDVPATAIRNPICVGRVSRRESLAEEEAIFLKSVTRRPVKVTLLGAVRPGRGDDPAG